MTGRGQGYRRGHPSQPPASDLLTMRAPEGVYDVTWDKEGETLPKA